ncbi:unnamed protein product [Ilex paraguariensis]|uniref:RWP-RK domain-containing protein n=1 Tax=Ilex paraguariensis TaxID=185542 RepID=A0ABC8V2K1_9AQUA
MAEPPTTVSYHNPFDHDLSSIEEILMSDENPNFDLSELPSLPENNSFHILISQSGDDNIADPDDPLVDPFVWEVLNDSDGNNSQAGPSDIHGQRTGHDRENSNPENLGFGNPVPLSIWPVSPVPYACSCCQVLREIIHTNGIHMTKLEIHGRLGMICHAVLENRYGAQLTTRNEEYQMFEESTSSVKQFLVQYCEGRKQAGYILLQDPLLIFYETLCVGLSGDDNLLDTDGFLQQSPTNSGDFQMNLPEMEAQPELVNQAEAERKADRLTKTSLAAQVVLCTLSYLNDNTNLYSTLPTSIILIARERTGKLTLKDVKQYFNLPIDEAAKKMNICPTVMKKICRRDGLLRWPYRKIKATEKKISKKKGSLAATDVKEKAGAQAEIESLQQELASIFAANSG